jgi:hypothetical protein
MDGPRFDTLTRALTAPGSRRRALVAALAGALGFFDWHGMDDAAAHNPLKSCKKKSGKQKKACLKKAKKHNAGHRIATCEDGVQNGNETGVDCGGSCPRCGTGQGCTSANDCASAVCTGTCQACTGGICGSHATGNCYCLGPAGGGAPVCVKDGGNISPCPGTPCPAGEICTNEPGYNLCRKPCGAP